MTNVCDSPTRNPRDADECKSGSRPPPPVPDHDTRHAITAPTRTFSNGRRNVCPHDGDAPRAPISGRHTVPGPSHDTRAPSPVDHTTRDGRAVTVTDTPGTATGLLRGDHTPRSIHNQAGNPTSCSSSGLGDDRITGDGTRNRARACIATTCGGTIRTRRAGGWPGTCGACIVSVNPGPLGIVPLLADESARPPPVWPAEGSVPVLPPLP